MLLEVGQQSPLGREVWEGDTGGLGCSQCSALDLGADYAGVLSVKMPKLYPSDIFSFCVYSTAIKFCKGGGWPKFSIFNVLSSFNWDNNYLIVSGTELSAFHIDSCAVLRARHYGEETEAQRHGELAKFICRLRGGGGFEPNQRPGAFTSSLKTTAQGNQEELGAARATLLGVSHWVSPPLSPQPGSS